MCITLNPFDFEAYKLSGVWVKDEYIKTMICAPEISEDDRFKWYSSLQERVDYRIWCVAACGRPVGICGIKGIHDNEGEYFGYLGSEEFRGKGYGKAMLLATINKATQELRLNRIKLKVIHENIPAISLYLKVGFEKYDSDNEFIYMRMTF